jgi:HSP20 family protein
LQSQENDRLVVQADVPGLKEEDINVEVQDGTLRLSGERRSEAERSERGYYHSERSYGSFVRVIPLPQGAKPETASASFENGVLRIEMEAPNGAGQARGRRIEVREGSPH